MPTDEILNTPGMNDFCFQWFVILRYLTWLEKNPEKDSSGLLKRIPQL